MLRVFTVALGLSGCAHESIERASLPPADLEATQAAELGGHWTNLTRICVDPDGTVVERSTKRPSGDPILGLLYLDDVVKRRYPKQRSQKCRDIRFEQDFGLDRSEGGAPVPTGEKTEKSVLVVMGRALHKPDPPEDRLASIARSEDLADWTFVNRTTFCVEVDGTVGAVKTLRSTGIPRIDAVVRETVAEWRFSPFEVGGKPTRICSEARFNLRFPG